MYCFVPVCQKVNSKTVTKSFIEHIDLEVSVKMNLNGVHDNVNSFLLIQKFWVEILLVIWRWQWMLNARLIHLMHHINAWATHHTCFYVHVALCKTYNLNHLNISSHLLLFNMVNINIVLVKTLFKFLI